MNSFKLTRKSSFTGKINTIEIPMSKEAFDKAHLEWINGKMIQNAFPNLNADQREFIMTGVTKEEWDEFIGEE